MYTLDIYILYTYIVLLPVAVDDDKADVYPFFAYLWLSICHHLRLALRR